METQHDDCWRTTCLGLTAKVAALTEKVDRLTQDNLGHVPGTHHMNVEEQHPGPSHPLAGTTINSLHGPGADPSDEQSKKTLRAELADYTANTTIHGVRFIGDSSLHGLDRLCWFLVFILSVLACLFMVLHQWRKWDQSPVVLTFANEMTPITDIPLPAITICTESKSWTKDLSYKYKKQEMSHKDPIYYVKRIDSSYNDVFNYTDALSRFPNISDSEWEFLQAAMQTCSVRPGYKELQKDKEWFRRTPSDTLSAMINMSSRYFELAPEYRVARTNYGEFVAHPLLTAYGVCYSYNILGWKDFYNINPFSHHPELEVGYRSKWSLEHGYDQPNYEDTDRPFRASGLDTSFRLRYIPNSLDLGCTGTLEQGAMITLHNPAEMPDVSRSFISAVPGKEIKITVTPTMIRTSEELRSYSPKQRNCYFPSERPLKYFKVYTQNNCLYECMMQLIRIVCDCTAFYMPSEEGIPRCGINMRCSGLAKRYFRYEEKEENTIRETAREKNMTFTECDCLPGCVDLQYNMETVQSEYNYTGNKTGGQTYSKVVISFKNHQFMSQTRSELFGTIEFLANCGGLLGLFTGFSVISLVEIIYYLTVRAGGSFFKRCFTKRAIDVSDEEKKPSEVKKNVYRDLI